MKAARRNIESAKEEGNMLLAELADGLRLA